MRETADEREAIEQDERNQPQNCAHCRFAKMRYEHQSAYWECRRRAPSVGNSNGSALGARGVFPDVQGDDWCGEFTA